MLHILARLKPSHRTVRHVRTGAALTRSPHREIAAVAALVTSSEPTSAARSEYKPEEPVWKKTSKLGTMWNGTLKPVE